MPHGGLNFTSGFYIFGAIFVLIAGLGVWMMVDTMRPKRRKQKAFKNIPREPLAIYACFGGLYAVLILLIWVLSLSTGAPDAMSMIALAGVPLMILVEMTYLLRVAFPKGGKMTAEELKELKAAAPKAKKAATKTKAASDKASKPAANDEDFFEVSEPSTNLKEK
jgi:ABC-type nickel/cobalt efflux system permease component RcnA